MLVLLFLLLGVVFLLAAVGRIWMHPSPLRSRATDSTGMDHLNESRSRKEMSKNPNSSA